jgi:hypothetical protein
MLFSGKASKIFSPPFETVSGPGIYSKFIKGVFSLFIARDKGRTDNIYPGFIVSKLSYRYASVPANKVRNSTQTTIFLQGYPIFAKKFLRPWKGRLSAAIISASQRQ